MRLLVWVIFGLIDLCFIIFHIALSYQSYFIMISSLSIYSICYEYCVISTEKVKLLSAGSHSEENSMTLQFTLQIRFTHMNYT